MTAIVVSVTWSTAPGRATERFPARLVPAVTTGSPRVRRVEVGPDTRFSSVARAGRPDRPPSRPYDAGGGRALPRVAPTRSKRASVGCRPATGANASAGADAAEVRQLPDGRRTIRWSFARTNAWMVDQARDIDPTPAPWSSGTGASARPRRHL